MCTTVCLFKWFTFLLLYYFIHLPCAGDEQRWLLTVAKNFMQKFARTAKISAKVVVLFMFTLYDLRYQSIKDACYWWNNCQCTFVVISLFGFLQPVRALYGALLVYRLPAIICYFVIIGSYTFDLGMKIYLYCKSDHSCQVKKIKLFRVGLNLLTCNIVLYYYFTFCGINHV